jgi:hypothetical protein
MDKYFVQETPGCSVSIEQRKALRENEYYKKLPWVTLKFIINRVALESLSSPENLKSRILEISGIGQLREMLDKRFFERAKTIRSFGVLAKTLPICDIGSTALRNHVEMYNKLLKGVDGFLNKPGMVIPDDVQNYIRDTRDYLELAEADKTLLSLGKLTLSVNDEYEYMNNDFKYLDLLDLLDDFDGAEDWKRKLAYLFGQYGDELKTRIAPFIADTNKDDTDTVMALLEIALSDIARFRLNMSGEIKVMLDHAHNRLGDILEQFEGQE